MVNRRLMVPFLVLLLLVSMVPFAPPVEAGQNVLAAGYEVGEETPPDWPGFWQEFNQIAGWDLEYYNGIQWISVKTDLQVVREYPSPNRTKLTLIFDASHAANYRLTFAISQVVRDYVTKLGEYRYELNYGNYSVVWDWSDAVSIPGIVFTHGFQDGMFWFRMRRDSVPLGAHVVIDPSLIASYPTGNFDSGTALDDTHPSAADTSAVGQSFQNRASPTKLMAVAFYLWQSGAPADGNLRAKLYTHSGVYGASSVPTGVALATSDPIASNTINNGGYQLYNFTFPAAQQYLMTASAYYCIHVERDSTGGVIMVGRDASAPTHGGNYFWYDSGAWSAAAGADTIFYVYGGSSPTNDNLAADPVFSRAQDGTATATVSDYDGVASLATVEMQVYTDANISLSLDGTDDYVDCGNDGGLSPTAALTLEAWIYPHVVNDWKQSSVIVMYDVGTYHSKIGLSNTGTVRADFYQDQLTGVAASAGACVANRWVHIAATFTPAASYAYKNGTPGAATGALANLQNVDPTLYVGREVVNGRYFDGLIEDVRVYSRALSATEVAEHYQGIFNNEAGLVLHLTFDGDMEDHSGSGNDGTAYNGATYDVSYAETFTLRWTQATDTFIELNDASNICTLSGTSARTNVDADTDEIAFVFTINDPATEGPCAVKLTTTDDDGFTDTDYYLAFTYSFWNIVADLINDAFAIFGISDYMTQITAYINGMVTYFSDSLHNIVLLVVQQFRFINLVFTSLLYWFTGFLSVLIEFVEFFQDLLDGVSVWYSDLGALWDWVGWNTWSPVLPYALFFWWLCSMESRSRVTPGGGIQVLINDFNTAANIISYFLGVFSFVANTIIDRVYGLIQAIF